MYAWAYHLAAFGNAPWYPHLDLSETSRTTPAYHVPEMAGPWGTCVTSAAASRGLARCTLRPCFTAVHMVRTGLVHLFRLAAVPRLRHTALYATAVQDVAGRPSARPQ